MIEGHRAGRRRGEGAPARRRAARGSRSSPSTRSPPRTGPGPRDEVEGLMAMFGERIDRETPELHEEGVRMRFIGRRDGRPAGSPGGWTGPRRSPRDNTRITLFVAFNYGGRAEIVDAARTFSGESEEEFRDHLYAPDMHDPDLLIRTSGEQRHLQLPALAVRLLGVRLPRRAVARLHARGLRGGARRVRAPPAPLRGALADERAGAGAGAAPRRPQRRGRRDLGPRIG